MESALILALLGLVFVSATGASDVLELSDADFQARVAGQDVMLVEFFAPWCGHCKRLAPEYETAATKLKMNVPSIPLAKVDCTEAGKETCSKYGVSGYPTLKIFRNGELSSDYEGGRTAKDIVSTMVKMAGPNAKEVTDVSMMEELLRTKPENVRPSVVGFFSADNDKKAAFVKAAGTLFENYNFLFSVKEDINKHFGYSDAVVLFRPQLMKNKFEEEKVEMSGSITKSAIEKFVQKNALGLCGAMTKDNEKLFKRPLVVAYYTVDYTKNPKGTNYWRNRVMKVGKEFSDKGLTFAIANGEEFGRELGDMGIDNVADTPVVVAWSAKGEKFKMEAAFSMSTFETFLKEYLAGDLKAYLKSEPVPASNDGPVKVVVAENFQEIVNDPTKDVLIEFYAPWCGHCKQLEPKYTELGEKLANVEHVVIAKMDATANDVPQPYEVQGFPTIYWSPADRKSSPRKYQGGREVDDFVSFIKKESTSPVEVDDKKKKKKKKTEL